MTGLVLQEGLVERTTALSDPTRLRILDLLRTRDHCVCHLVERLELKQSLISHHIGVLRRAGLVESYPHAEDRRWLYYRANRERLRELAAAIERFAGDDEYNPEPLPCPVDLQRRDA